MSKAISIDDRSTRDRDDAFWFTPTDTGYLIEVFISDVAAMVPRGAQFDITVEKEFEIIGDAGTKTMEMRTLRGAYDRVETRYYAQGNSPMLPHFLSENKLSLVPNKKRRVMRIAMMVDKGFVPQGRPAVGRAKIVNQAGLAYTEISQILEDSTHEWHAQIALAKRFALTLLQRRRDLGAMAIYDLNEGWVTNEEGVVVKLRREDTIGHIIIQELMILSNMALSQFCLEAEIPVLWRNHMIKPHAPDRKQIMSDIEVSVGQSLEVIDALRGRVNLFFERANYGVELQGHYGLAATAYLHATSPIRRYADLVNWRQICAWLDEVDALPYTVAELAAVAEHLNAHRDRKETESKEFYRQRDTKKGEKIVAQQHYVGLTRKEFERTTKLILRQSRAETSPPGYAIEVAGRVERGELALLVQTLLFAEAPSTGDWPALKAVLIEHLATRPHEAASIVSQAVQVSGWGLVTYTEIGRSGLSHAPVFVVQGTVTVSGKEYSSGPVMAQSVKRSRQVAALALLCQISGVAVPKEIGASVSVASSSPEIVAVPVPDADASNPISALGEFAAKMGHSPPTYTASHVSGPSHSPVFVSVCHFEGKETSARGASKKLAKAAAARALLVGLSGGRPKEQS